LVGLSIDHVAQINALHPVKRTDSRCQKVAPIRRQLKRRYVLAFFQKLSRCLVGIEACASSLHSLNFLHVAVADGRHMVIVPSDCDRVPSFSGDLAAVVDIASPTNASTGL
jgi:hypothetical protein